MRWLFVSLALLAAMPAHADSRVRSRLSTHRQPAGDVAARYRFIGRTDGTWDPSFSRHARPTVTGPATTVDRGDGTAVTVPANTLAVGQAGALVYGARTSRVLYNQRDSTNNAIGGMLDASWIKRGTAAVAADCVAAPDGSCTADEVALGAIDVDDIRSLVSSGFTSNAQIAFSIWIERVSTSGTISIRNPYNQANGRWDIDLAAIGAGWQRLTTAHPAVTVSVPFSATASGQAGIRLGTPSGDATVRFWRPWQQEGTLGPDAEVQSAPLSVAATAVSVPIPAGAVELAYLLGGTRQTLDLSGISSPLTIGQSQTLDATGVFGDLVFCRTAGCH